MVKKTLIMASILVFSTAAISFSEDIVQTPDNTGTTQSASDFQRSRKGPDFQKRNAEFEKRLKLSDKQKTKAEEIRKQGFEQMKPIMDKLQEKKAEFEAIKKSEETGQAQQEKIDQLNKEIGALNRAAHEIRMQNMKDFEGILSRKQKKEMKKMKEEGRKKFEEQRKKGAHHPGGPEFGPNGPEGGFPPPPPESEKTDE